MRDTSALIFFCFQGCYCNVEIIELFIRLTTDCLRYSYCCCCFFSFAIVAIGILINVSSQEKTILQYFCHFNFPIKGLYSLPEP